MKIKEIIILVLLILPACLALLKPGFFGSSDDMHIAWLQQMDQTLKTGQVPPRYVPDLSFGFGYPLFNFIFPLPYYLGELFHLVGFSFTYSIKAVFVFSLFASGLSMYLLVRYLSDRIIALAAAVLYVYTPYRSTDIYVRGALGEALSFVFLPLIVYGIIRLSKATSKNNVLRWLGLTAISIAGLILTHNIVSYMFMPFAFLLGLFLLRKKILHLILLLLMGLAGSSYFWIPALVDSNLMKYETIFNFIDHFPTLKQLFVPFWGYGASVPGPYDGMSFFMGEVNIAIIIVCIFFILLKFKQINLLMRNILLWALVLIFSAIFMMNFRSTLLWEKIPLIAYFQFPWRFLTVTTFGSALLVCVLRSFKYSKIWAVMVIILSIAFNYSRLKPHDFLPRTDSYFLNRYIPIPTPSKEYLQIQEEYLRLPKLTEVRPSGLQPRVYPDVSQITIENSLDAHFAVNTNSDLVLNYNKYYFPGWVGTIDGKNLILSAGEPNGQIQFKVPAGKHIISVSYRETWRNIILDILSITTIVVSVYFISKKQINLT